MANPQPNRPGKYGLVERLQHIMSIRELSPTNYTRLLIVAGSVALLSATILYQIKRSAFLPPLVAGVSVQTERPQTNWQPVGSPARQVPKAADLPPDRGVASGFQADKNGSRAPKIRVGD